LSEIIALAGEVRACRQCRLSRYCKNQIAGEGTEAADVMFVLQSPGWVEDRDDAVAVGWSGQFLKACVDSLDLGPSQVYITNLIKCYPGRVKGKGEKPPPDFALKACADWLEAEIAIVNPKLIVAVGLPVAKWFGIKGGINSIAAIPFETKYGMVMPIRSATMLFRRKEDVPKFFTELKAVTTFLSGGSPLPARGNVREALDLMMVPPFIGADIEVEDEKIWCLGVGSSTGRDAVRGNGFARYSKLLLEGGIPVFQNAKFDMRYLEDEWGKKFENWEDTILQGALLGHKPLNLPSMSSVFLGEPLDKTFVKERKKIKYGERPEMVLEGCSKDASAAEGLNALFLPEIGRRGLCDIYEKEKKVTRILQSMEATGLPVNQKRLKLANGTLLRRMGQLESLLRTYGFDEPRNAEQIGQAFWRNKKKVITTPTGKLSTKKDDLRTHRNPDEEEWTEAIIEWKALAKFKSTYIDAWTGLDFVHASINQTGTISWRFSVSGPNLQNIPKVKSIPLFQLFVAPDGWLFVSLDYSQIELRVLANIADDRNLKNVYLTGGDLHSRRIEQVAALTRMTALGDTEMEKEFWLDKARRIAKIINFGIPYGITGHGIQKKTRIEADMDITDEEGDEYIQEFYRDHPDVKAWQLTQETFAEEHGYVETFAGRPLYVPGMLATEGAIRSHAENQTWNLPIQGGAAEIVKDAMIRCPEYLVMQVHDELLYLVPEAKAQAYFDHLKKELVDTRHEVPYTVDGAIGKTWGEIKHIPDVLFDDLEDDD